MTSTKQTKQSTEAQAAETVTHQEQPPMRPDIAATLGQEALERAQTNVQRLRTDLAEARVASQLAQQQFEIAQRAWDRAEAAGVAHTAAEGARLTYLTSDAQRAKASITLIQQHIDEAEIVIRQDAAIAARLRREQLVEELWPDECRRMSAAVQAFLEALREHEAVRQRLEDEPGALGLCEPPPLRMDDFVFSWLGGDLCPQLTSWLEAARRAGYVK